MTRSVRFPRQLTILVLLLLIMPTASIGEDIRCGTDPAQQIDVPFRLFRTENVWNQLLLDTRDGRLWQVAFTVDTVSVRARIPINTMPLVSGRQPTVGRFTLYPTGNMWTFLMLDQIDGRVWQCQFSTGEGQMILPIFDIGR